MTKRKNKGRAISRNMNRQAKTLERLEAAGAVVTVADLPRVGEGAVSQERAMEALEAGRLREQGYGRREAEDAARLLHFSFGHRQVTARDGLVWLNDTGALTGKLGRDAKRTATDWMRGSVRFYALLAYRECMEAAASALGSALAPEKVMAGGSGGSGTSDRFVAAWAAAGQKAVRLGTADRAVLARYPGGEELNALRRIAGLGHTARSLARNGREADEVTAALLRAADVVAPIMGIPGCEVLRLEEGLAGKRCDVVIVDEAGLAAVAAPEPEPLYEPVEIPEGQALAAHVRGRLLGDS